MKVWLVPIEVFSAGFDPLDPDDFSYGLCDAVGAGSDCNRAVGHMYRIETDPRWAEEFLKPGECLEIEVDPERFWPFHATRFEGDEPTVTRYRPPRLGVSS